CTTPTFVDLRLGYDLRAACLSWGVVACQTALPHGARVGWHRKSYERASDSYPPECKSSLPFPSCACGGLDCNSSEALPNPHGARGHDRGPREWHIPSARLAASSAVPRQICHALIVRKCACTSRCSHNQWIKARVIGILMSRPRGTCDPSRGEARCLTVEDCFCEPLPPRAKVT